MNSSNRPVLTWILIGLATLLVVVIGYMVLQPRTITVIGTADSVVQNQIATYSAGVQAVNEDKNSAVETVNESMAEIVQMVKDFGIADEDIQTESNSIWQEEEPVTVGTRQLSEPGRWRVSNTVSIKLRDISRAAELTDLLSTSDANNVWGPTFSVDDTSAADGELLSEALENARDKATSLAQSQNMRVGMIVSITEADAGQGSIPFGRGLGGSMSESAVIEAGSQTISKSVIVTFRLQ